MISTAPVKGFRLLHPDQIELTPEGVVQNRRFVLVDGERRRLRSSKTPWPVVVRGEYDAGAERLRVEFPDGAVVEGSALGAGEPFETDFHERNVAVRAVPGDWNERLSALAGHTVRVARPERIGESLTEPVTLVSDGSLARLEREAGREIDARRFRMLLTLEGCEAYEEDTWAGRVLGVGDALLRVGGPVERCAVTTRDPDTGERDLDALRLIKAYRGVRNGNQVDFGVYATVERPGRVRVGDPVELV